MSILENKNITIFKETVLPGESKTINMEIATLHTMTKLKIAKYLLMMYL
jgi:hypothetical protein